MNKKKIGKLKTKFREKMKEKNHKATIARDLSRLSVEYNRDWWGKSEFYTQAYFTNGVLEIDDDTSYPFKEDLYLEMIDEFWLPLAKEKELDAIIVPSQRTAITDKLIQQGYKKVKEVMNVQDWKVNVGNIGEEYYIKEINPGKLNETIKFNQAIKEAINKLKEEDVTMSYKTEREEDKIKVTYYYQGLNQHLTYAISNGVATFGFDNEEVVCKTPDEAKKTLEEYFKKLYNKQKVKNIFNYPKMHFETYMSKNVTNAKKIQDAVHEHLKTKHLPKDIEEHFAQLKTQVIQAKYQTRSWRETHLFVLMDMVFVSTENQEVYAYSIDEYEKSKEKFEEVIMKIVKTEIDNAINPVDNQIKKKQAI